jgi:nicotinamide riboside kinase
MRAKKIIVTGPESTGKTVLCEYLADYYGGRWIQEFARTYIEALESPYTLNDVIEIGKKQIDQLDAEYKEYEMVFFDTGLIITKVWLELVFNESPSWIDNALNKIRPDLVLLCYPDLDWKADPVRENGGLMRNHLFKKYEENLKQYGYPYEIVKGESEDRNKSALNAISKTFKK